MPWQTTPLTGWLLVATAVSGLVVVMAWRYRRNPGVPSFAILMAAATLWALAYTAELSAVTLARKVLFSKVMYVGVAAVPVAWLLFALEYTGRVMPLRRDNLVLFGVLGVSGRDEYLTRRNLLLLLVVPVLTAILTLTNGRHGLMWSGQSLVNAGGYLVLDVEYGPWFWVHAAYSYVLIATGVVFIAQLLVRSRHVYRGQAALVLGAIAVPWAANAAYLADAVPVTGIDPTPIGFTATGVLVFAALWRYRLLDVVPIAREVARDQIIEDMADGVIVLDRSDRVVDLNRTARSLGGNPEDPVGRPVADVLPAVDGLIADDREGATEVELAVDGEDRVFEGRVSPIASRSGLLTGRVVFLRDVTDRHRTEERFRALIEHSSDIITILDTDGVVRYMSPSVERVLGGDAEEWLDESALDRIHPDDRDRVRRELLRLVETEDGVTGPVEYRVRDADGEWRWLETVGSNRVDAAVIQGVVLNSRDVTDRKETERRFESLVERSTDVIIVLDGDGRFTYVSSGVERIFGYDPDELAGDLAFEYVHPDDRESVAAAFAEVAENPGDTRTIGYRNRTADGGWLDAEARVRNLLDDPAVGGIVVYVRDVSERRDHERRLEALHETARELLDARDRETVVDACVRAAESIIGLNVVGVFLEADGVLEPAAATQDATELFDEIPRFGPGTGVAWAVYESGEAVVADDITTRDDVLNPETPVRSEMLLPIGDAGVFVAASTEPAAFDDAQVSLARVLVSTLEAALDAVEDR